MESQFITLSIIAAIAFIAPYIASLIPGRPIPETVFLVFTGAAFGPYGLSIIHPGATSLEFLSELGLAFLFLMAGYEIEVDKLVGNLGKHATISWIASLLLAVLLVFILPIAGISGIGKTALAIAMTTTAYGTLAPILRDRGLINTPVGDAVVAFGATGELYPILAMALLLSSRGHLTTILILFAFIAVCGLCVMLPQVAHRIGAKVINFLRDNAETGSQAPVRLTVLLLIALVGVSAAMGLDAVLGAFAAGFVLRASLPKGDKLLDTKLEGISFGFLVPVFFVISGSEVDMTSVFKNPTLLIIFIIGLLLVRTIPILITLHKSTATQDFTHLQRLSCALYCTMALPLIVAVTQVAVATNTMTQEVASVLVGAGALTVLIVPLLTAVIVRVEALHPVEALHEIVEEPHHMGHIILDHAHHTKEISHQLAQHRKLAFKHGHYLSSCDFLATAQLDHENQDAKQQ